MPWVPGSRSGKIKWGKFVSSEFLKNSWMAVSNIAYHLNFLVGLAKFYCTAKTDNASVSFLRTQFVVSVENQSLIHFKTFKE